MRSSFSFSCTIIQVISTKTRGAARENHGLAIGLQVSEGEGQVVFPDVAFCHALRPHHKGAWCEGVPQAEKIIPKSNTIANTADLPGGSGHGRPWQTWEVLQKDEGKMRLEEDHGASQSSRKGCCTEEQPGQGGSVKSG
eukprot:222147-Pelagomonas_calceolata.AAC.1